MGTFGINSPDGGARARTVQLPAGKDITAAHVDHGVDLAAWVAEVLG